ncbi:hypothetical protein AARAC_001136, partial [Aspergillus arachidicola]
TTTERTNASLSSGLGPSPMTIQCPAKHGEIWGNLQFLPRLNDDTADHEKNNGTNVSHICLVHHWCVSR